VHHLIEVPAGDQPELRIDALWAAGAVGIEERAGVIIAAFDQDHPPTDLAESLGGAIREVADDVGLDAWREHFVAQEAGPFTVRAPWQVAPNNNGVAIDMVIDPGHSFGSGSHPSTRLALELLASSVQLDDNVVDLGSGSGVLSIASLLVGAGHATAIDIDPGAAAVAEQNAQANDVETKLAARTESAATTTGCFDLCIANVTIDIHESIAPSVAANILAPRLLVAGILAGDQEHRAATAYERQVIKRLRDGEWAALLLGDADNPAATPDQAP